jgi:hypothetical protein
MAQYASTSSPWLPPRGYSPWTPKPWTTWMKHQYAGNGGYRVRGIAGDVDCDLFNGDLETFKEYMGPARGPDGAHARSASAGAVGVDLGDPDCRTAGW